MRWLREVRYLMRRLNRRRADQELDDELRAHLELEIQENVENGMSPRQARHRALRRFGNLTLAKEETRAMWGFHSIEMLLRDLRYASRLLRRSPGFTAVAALSLALGIGANSAVYSIVNALLLHPYPFSELSRLMLVRETREGDDVGQGRMAPADFLDLQRDSGAFDAVAATSLREFTLTGAGDPEKVWGARVSSDFFDLLGVRPGQGRAFYADEGEEGRNQVVVVSHAFWQQRLGADPNLIGKTLHFNGRAYTVVGIMAQDFRYPLGIEMWSPLTFTAAEKTERAKQTLRVLGRLAPGVAERQAEAQMRLFANQLAEQYPGTNARRNVTLLPLRQEQYEYTAPLFLTLQGAAAFVLLLAGVNVGNLLLARIVRRQKEVAIRLALGANRLRLLRLFVSEMMLLSVLGGAAATAAAFWSVPLIRASMPEGIARYVAGWETIHVDGWVLGFTGLLVGVVGILFGVAIGLRSSKLNLDAALREGGKGSGSGNRHHRLRGVLVISEVVLAMVLLAGAGLMIRGFQRLANAYQGFQPAGILSFDIALPQSNYADDARVATFYDQALQAMAGLARTESVAVMSNIPASNVDSARAFFSIEGRPALAASDLPAADLQTVSADIFQTLRVPLRDGRAFTRQDGREAMRVAIVNESMAKKYWPNEDVLGRRLKLPTADAPADAKAPWLTIVGVVGDVKQNWFEPEVRPVLYVPYAQAPERSLTVLLRTQGDPMAVVPEVRSVIWRIDPGQPISSVQSMEGVISDAIAPVRIIGMLMVVFGALALVLALVGVYAVLAYWVADRRQEFGIRLALGARPGDVLRLVFRQALKLSGVGLALALPTAFVFSRIMASFFFGVVELDIATFLGLTLALLCAILSAGYIPARTATKVDPMSALREG